MSTGVHAIVSVLRNQPRDEVQKRVRAELEPVADLSKSAGKAVLEFRAKFVTELRKQGVWP